MKPCTNSFGTLVLKEAMLKLANLYNRIELNRSPIKWLIVLILWMVLGYMLPNKINLIEPIMVPKTFVDALIPLSPVWIWPYISYYFFIFGTFLFVRSEHVKKLVFSSYSLSAAVACLIFFLIPTAIERENYPIQENAVGLSVWALNFIRSADTSINCLPSMHIALSAMAALALIKESRKLTLPAVLWFLLISYSTMATKQHYFLDVAAGVLFGLFFWLYSNKLFKISN